MNRQWNAPLAPQACRGCGHVRAVHLDCGACTACTSCTAFEPTSDATPPHGVLSAFIPRTGVNPGVAPRTRRSEEGAEDATDTHG